MSDAPQILLARQCAAKVLDHVRFLIRPVELEPIVRERRMIERGVKAAKFPVAKSLDSFDLKATLLLHIIKMNSDSYRPGQSRA